ELQAKKTDWTNVLKTVAASEKLAADDDDATLRLQALKVLAHANGPATKREAVEGFVQLFRQGSKPPHLNELCRAVLDLATKEPEESGPTVLGTETVVLSHLPTEEKDIRQRYEALGAVVKTQGFDSQVKLALKHLDATNYKLCVDVLTEAEKRAP